MSSTVTDEEDVEEVEEEVEQGIVEQEEETVEVVEMGDERLGGHDKESESHMSNEHTPVRRNYRIAILTFYVLMCCCFNYLVYFSNVMWQY